MHQNKPYKFVFKLNRGPKRIKQIKVMSYEHDFGQHNIAQNTVLTQDFTDKFVEYLGPNKSLDISTMKTLSFADLFPNIYIHIELEVNSKIVKCKSSDPFCKIFQEEYWNH